MTAPMAYFETANGIVAKIRKERPDGGIFYDHFDIIMAICKAYSDGQASITDLLKDQKKAP